MAPRSASPPPSRPGAGGGGKRRVSWSSAATAGDLTYCIPPCEMNGHACIGQAAKILGPPTSFNAAKLKVEFVGGEEQQQRMFPRAYTLTHCDFTANLTLAVSDSISSEQLRSWQRDDVFAEWKEMMSGEMTLHVHCYVSGASLLQELAAGFRYYVFSKELPLVLKAVVYGDAALFAEQPELMEAKVWVHFHSSSNKYNRIECWGPLRDASKRNLLLVLDGRRLDQLRSAITRRPSKWPSPETIFNALLALLL